MKDGLQTSEPSTLNLEMSVGKKGDVNGDGKVDISDTVSLVNIILNKDETPTR